ncbi:MAG: class I SAM-dependent methyltransferase [Bacteroidia bacterium]|nr:class I SAM-dependent methyltransferase [Bacteroidia bacterium]
MHPLLFRIARRINRWLTPYRVAEQQPLPMQALSAEHLRSLRVVPDRRALLEQLPKGAVIAEIGVDQGDFSAQILEICQPSVLYLIDVWGSARYHEGLYQAVQTRFQAEMAAGRVQIRRGYSTERLPEFADSSLDWVYLDTDHTYATTRQELEILRHKVKPGGIIAGHDFTIGSWNRGIRYGVVEAVHEFCLAQHWELIWLTHEPDRTLSFAIRQAGKG